MKFYSQHLFCFFFNLIWTHIVFTLVNEVKFDRGLRGSLRAGTQKQTLPCIWGLTEEHWRTEKRKEDLRPWSVVVVKSGHFWRRVIYIEILRNKHRKKYSIICHFSFWELEGRFCCLFFKTFLMWVIFKVFIEFSYGIVPLFYINIYIGFMLMNHVESWLLNQGLNPHPLHWKATS